jgi:membrane dipeptidase
MGDVQCIDIHSHIGWVHEDIREDQGVQHESNGWLMAPMANNRVAAIVVSTIADRAITKWGTNGKAGEPGAMAYNDRAPRPGECWQDNNLQLQRIEHWIDKLGLARITKPEEIGGHPGVILAIEGGCPLEGRLDRLEQYYTRGVRAFQLVHYRANEFADVQTSPPRHGGLSALGGEAVREMNRLGIIVDVTHSTFEAVNHTAEASSRPIVLSHATMAFGEPHPRFVSPDYVRVVAQTGGVIGVQAAAFRGRGMLGFVENVKRMIDAVGIDHVSIGTDMGTETWPPVSAGVFSDLTPFATVPTLLSDAGLADEEIRKIASGNFLRVFSQVSSMRVTTWRAS